MITTRILLHSANPDGEELVTMESTYPRPIHSEFMTHRAFSRNSASSRAIPIATMISNVKRNGDDVIEQWGSKHPKGGMQAGDNLEGDALFNVKKAWARALDEACHYAEVMDEDGCAKQIANRIIEPFSHITVIHTATNRGLANFFKLRAHAAAQPEFQVLAFRMLNAYLHSTPRPLDWNHWHMPMAEDLAHLPNNERIMIATGRIARVSYETHNKVRDLVEDRKLHDRLVRDGHWSPFEHCAQAKFDRLKEKQIGNFGPRWLQYRKMFETENFSDSRKGTLLEIMANKPAWITI